MINSVLARQQVAGRASAGQLRGIKYFRASQDASGRAVSVASQRDEGDELFEEFGIVDAGEFCDNNLSASTYATEVRAAYEWALTELRSGRANLLWTWDSARAQRDLAVYVKLREICKETGSFWAYGGRIYDMKDPADRKATARDALEAEGASDVISGHVKRGKRKRARQGKHAGPVPYGYSRLFDPETGESLGRVLDEGQAAIVREIVAWVLEKKPLSWVAGQLNERGVPCARAGLWNAPKVKALVQESQHKAEWEKFLRTLSPENAVVARELVARVVDGESAKELARELNRDEVAYVLPSVWTAKKVRNVALSQAAAGIAVYQGQPVLVKQTDESGEVVTKPVKAQWPAIISPEDRTLLTAMLHDPARSANRDGSRVRHFWSGIARCAECDKGLTANVDKVRGRIYRCPTGHVYVDQQQLDAWLLEQAMCQLERTDARKLFRIESSNTKAAVASQQAQVLRAELEGWKADAVAGRVSRASFIDIEAGLLERIAKLDEQSKRATLPPTLAKVIGPQAREAFLALGDVTAQREILRAMMRPRVGKSRRPVIEGLDTGSVSVGFLYGKDVAA
ncbi:recombinase family protein [Amycolatopsis sp. NPDC059657]|uniref:recombinase family protein n=1 Tax=Amycolatopsis sp. NPDC059657 TaxID=3346899 RepID=UPI00366E0430